MIGTGWKRTFLALPGIGISLLPKLMCPACWPAYAGLISAVGLGFLISSKYLLLTTVVFLAITATALGFHSSRRHGPAPLWLGLGASILILMGKFRLESTYTTYAGIGLLIAASLWNSWPVRATCRSCPARETSKLIDQTHS